MKIGVLDLQGDVREHLQAIEACQAEAVPVKRTEQLHGLQGLIIPGGESTTLGKLMVQYDFMDAIRDKASQGMGVLGTCAGMILLATDIAGSDQPRLGLIDMRVQRNAFGRQRESFETEIQVDALGTSPVHAVFIRAPYIESVGEGVTVMARVADKIVMVKQGRHLALAFHPELTEDLRVHRFFLEGLQV